MSPDGDRSGWYFRILLPPKEPGAGAPDDRQPQRARHGGSTVGLSLDSPRCERPGPLWRAPGLVGRLFGVELDDPPRRPPCSVFLHESGRRPLPANGDPGKAPDIPRHCAGLFAGLEHASPRTAGENPVPTPPTKSALRGSRSGTWGGARRNGNAASGSAAPPASRSRSGGRPDRGRRGRRGRLPRAAGCSCRSLRRSLLPPPTALGRRNVALGFTADNAEIVWAWRSLT